MAAQQAAMTEANDFCVRQGRQFLPTDRAIPPDPNMWGREDYSVTFKCLLPGDPALAQGGSTRAPDAIVEHRER
jgi:hypothetical protein